MRDGRPNGKGRLEIRSGEVFEGEWTNGLLSGSGLHIDAGGNRYEGMFAAGVPHGHGRYLARTGEIFEGEFRDGLRQGKGTTRLAGGSVYESEWDKGKEIGGTRPDLLADALSGGLVKTQSGGGAADKVEIGVSGRRAHDAAVGHAIPASRARGGHRDLSGRRGHERRLERHRRDNPVFGRL